LNKKIVFFATDWGYTFGGVNALNIDLCKAVAALVERSVDVVCVVAASPSPNWLEEPGGVRVLRLPMGAESSKSLSAPAVQFLKEELGKTAVTWWIGHDVITGPWAQDAYNEFGGHLVLIHHMDYEAYKYLQLGEVEHAEKLIDEQKTMLASASVVLAVGPKLAHSASRKLADRVEVKPIIPGLSSIPPRQAREGFKAIVMGRLEPRNNIVKQLQLAADAFGNLVRKTPDPRGFALTVLGVSHEELITQFNDLQATVSKKAGRLVNVLPRPYQENRQKVLDTLAEHDALLMLSYTEGFGLAGWEAIGAGVPLIVSEDSGVFETVTRLAGGMGTGCLHGIDVRASATEPYYRARDLEDVTDALLDITAHKAQAKENAAYLKALIGDRCTWENTAAEFCTALGVPTRKPVHSLKVQPWSAEDFESRLKSRNTSVKAATRQQYLSQPLWDGLKSPSRYKRFLMLFGGVSTSLSDDHAFEAYTNWLTTNRDAELWICYEAGESVRKRGQGLDPSRYLSSFGTVPLDPPAATRLVLERMREKEANVKAFCERLSQHLQDRADGSANRLRSLPVNEQLTTYVIVADDELFVTPLISERSSLTQTLSYHLQKAEDDDMPVSVLWYVIHNLRRITGDGAVDRAITYLKYLIEEYDHK